MKHMRARYASNCAYEKCFYGGRISVGQEFTWSRRGTKGVWHVDCKEAMEREQGTYSEPIAVAAFTNDEPITATTNKGTDQLLGILTDALVGPITARLETLESRSDVQLDEGRIVELIHEHAVRETSVTIDYNGEHRNLTGLVHKDVASIAELLTVHGNVYIHGAAGAGKTTMARQIAELLGACFEVFQMGKLSPESSIKGFIDGNGQKQEQRFIAAIQRPCLVFLDEFDRWPSHLATLLNSLLANGYIDARGHDTHIYRHPKCYILAAGNTTMRGRDEYFPEAVAQEFSTIDRFAYFHVDYDLDLERAVSQEINPCADAWVRWVQALRPEAMSGKHGKVVATPRASYEGSKLIRYTSLSLDAIADALVFKGIERSTRDKLVTMFPLPTITQRKPTEQSAIASATSAD